MSFLVAENPAFLETNIAGQIRSVVIVDFPIRCKSKCLSFADVE